MKNTMFALLGLRAAAIALCLPLLGCDSKKAPSQIPEPKVTGDTVIIPSNSPQLAALRIEPVAVQQPAFVPLAGRLMWDENATVRVFTPFAGIVRKLLVDVNQRVSKGTPLAEIQ